MKQDRFLTGILIGIGALIVIALALFFTRQSTLKYVDDSTPAGVVNNYTLALYNKDYQKAYGYLAEKEGKPTYEKFRQGFANNPIENSNAGLRIGEATIEGDHAYVATSVVYPGGDPLSRGYSNSEQAQLVMQNGAWKLEYSPYPFWQWDWYQPTPEKPAKP
jgi:hypothetical protein